MLSEAADAIAQETGVIELKRPLVTSGRSASSRNTASARAFPAARSTAAWPRGSTLKPSDFRSWSRRSPTRVVPRRQSSGQSGRCGTRSTR